MSENEKKNQTTPAPAKKPKEKAKQESGMKRWLLEMKVELKKVLWPNKKQTVTFTSTVLGCVAIVGFFIWIFDYLAGNVILALGTLV